MFINSAEIIKQTPETKSGWPWTIVTEKQNGHSMPANFKWPKISIVTPSFNQGQYLEETIRSVLLQGYPRLEYIIIDGGSTDNSVEIIKKYAPWISYWISEKDRGQGHAINKGFKKATGELAGWVNSDDIYLPGALRKVAEIYASKNYPNAIITGTKLKGNTSLQFVSREQQSPYTLQHLLERCILEQPATFFPLELFLNVGGINETYQMALDYDLWLRMTRKGAGIIFIDYDFAVTRTHQTSKSIKYQRISYHEAIKTVWQNYRVVTDAWLRKYLTFTIIPRDLKPGVIKRILIVVRNILFWLSSSFLKLLNISHYDKRLSCKIEVMSSNDADRGFSRYS